MDYRSCKKHTNIQAPGFCPICFMEERDRYLAALRFLELSARELLAVSAVETAAYRRRWRIAIEQAQAVCSALDNDGKWEAG